MKSQAILTVVSLTIFFNNPMLFAWGQSPNGNKQLLLVADRHSRLAKELIEEFGFQINHYSFDYQGQKNVLDIDVLYRYISGIEKSQYPDVIVVKKDLEEFLVNYPNKKQYWEIINKDAVKMLVNKYPSLSSVTIKLKVYPNEQQSFPRISIVTLSRN